MSHWSLKLGSTCWRRSSNAVCSGFEFTHAFVSVDARAVGPSGAAHNANAGIAAVSVGLGAGPALVDERLSGDPCERRIGGLAEPDPDVGISGLLVNELVLVRGADGGQVR